MSFRENKIDIPTIPEYFRGKSIFITGGSGFMGQALVEKLLYSCPELDSIYLLMRQKRGVPPEDRLEKLYSSSCFDRLREEKPTIFKEKVHIMPGDVTELGLGLSESNRKLVTDKINVVFHVAASVRFDDALKYAAKMNIRGTRELVELAKEMNGLSSFVHVSTCYCNTNYEVIDEVLYPPLADWREVLEVCETIDDELAIRALTPKYLNGMPNTYVFTKQLAEHVVSEQRGKLPIVIVRPSIVTSSREEPAPGWHNNYNGPIGLSIACGSGLKRSIYGKPTAELNYVPLDVCIKAFIVIAWSRGTVKIQDTDDVPIFNSCVSKEDTITVKDYGEKATEVNKLRLPLNITIWNTTVPTVTNVFTLHYFITILCSFLPAVLIDGILALSGKKPQLVKIVRKIYIADIVMNYYLTHRNWTLTNENFLKMRETIKEEDKKAFYYSSENLFKTDYLDKAIMGAKKYLLNEDVKDLAQAKARIYRLKILDRFVKIVLCGCVVWWIFKTRYFKTKIYPNFVFATQRFHLERN